MRGQERKAVADIRKGGWSMTAAEPTRLTTVEEHVRGENAVTGIVWLSRRF